MGVTAKPIATPNPNELALRVAVPESILLTHPEVMPKAVFSADASNNLLAQDGTPASVYGGLDAQLADRKVSGAFSNYVYTYAEDGPPDSGIIYLYFARPKTAQERATPILPQVQSQDNHYWPPVLEFLQLLEDDVFQQSANFYHPAYGPGTVYAVRRQVLRGLRPEIAEGTTFVETQFLSEIPFQLEPLRVPQPAEVYVNLLGEFVYIFKCLVSKEIRIPAPDGSYTVQFSGGNFQEVPNGINAGEQVIPATNFTSWQAYICRRPQERVGGQYWLKSVLAVPPPVTPIVTEGH